MQVDYIDVNKNLKFTKLSSQKNAVFQTTTEKKTKKNMPLNIQNSSTVLELY